MTTTERITQLEAELQRCVQQVQHWTTAQLRTEGALLILRQIKDEDEKVTNLPTADPDDSVGPSGEHLPPSHV